MIFQSFTFILFLLQFTILKGANLTNSSTTTSVTETQTTLNQQSITTNGSIAIEITTINASAVPSTTLTPAVTSVTNETGTTVKLSKTTETVHEVSHTTSNERDINGSSTIIVNCFNLSSNNNETCDEHLSNETGKANYSIVAEAIGAPSQAPTFGLQETTAVAAGVFLISSVLGYLSCVGYRRYLQRKYGNSQVLVTEDVYDTTDLRYFEI